MEVKAYDQVTSTIYFHRNLSLDDTEVITMEYSMSEDIGRLPPVDFNYEGHILLGYSDDPNSKEIIYAPTAYISYWLIQSTQEVHLYAIWGEIDEEYGGVIFIGDSYVGTSNWPYYTAEALGLKSYIESGLGGTGFTNVAVDPNGRYTNFELLLEDAILLVGESNYKKMKWVIIEGGYNDQYYEQTAIDTSIDSFVKRCKDVFPNAKIVIGMSGYNVSNPDVRNMLDKTSVYYSQACDRNGIHYMKGIEHVFNENDSAYFLEDTFHPNGEGGKKLGEYSAKMITQIKNEKSPLVWVGLFLFLLLSFLIYKLFEPRLLMHTRKKVNKR